MDELLADLYTPLLAVATLGLMFKQQKVREYAPVLMISLLLLLAGSWLERQLGLWQSWGLDYSTHTAVLLPFYQLLFAGWRSSRLQNRKRASLSWLMLLLSALASGIGYAGLMQSLGYHSAADMITTILSSWPLVWICYHYAISQPVADSGVITPESADY